MQDPPHILIVEDEWLIAEATRTLLEDLGFTQIRCCYDLRSGLEAAEAERVDLALLDVNLAADLVFPLAARLRARGAAIIFATSMRPESLPEAWRSACVLSKPVH